MMEHDSQEKAYAVDQRGIATLQITCGGPLNIISSVSARLLTATLRDIAVDSRVRVVLLRGSGTKTFVGGADIREMAALSPEAARAFITDLHALCEAVRDMPVPTVAVVRGWCIGVGLELASACDLRIASDDAHFTMPEVRIGIPSVIQGAFLTRLVGEGRARWLMLTGESIDSITAERWGLLNEVAGAEALDSAVDRLARLMAAHGAAGMRAQKRVLRTGEAPHLDAAMRHSIEIFSAPFETTEPADAMQAFLSKRRHG